MENCGIVVLRYFKAEKHQILAAFSREMSDANHSPLNDKVVA